MWSVQDYDLAYSALLGAEMSQAKYEDSPYGPWHKATHGVLFPSPLDEGGFGNFASKDVPGSTHSMDHFVAFVKGAGGLVSTEGWRRRLAPKEASWTVGTADSTANVLRTTKPAPSSDGGKAASVSLARGEKEGIQLVVHASQHTAGFTWSVSQSTHVDTGSRAELDVQVAPVGYVHRGSFCPGVPDNKCPSPVAHQPNPGGSCPFNTSSGPCST